MTDEQRMDYLERRHACIGLEGYRGRGGLVVYIGMDYGGETLRDAIDNANESAAMKMFQISEDDLETLEHALPCLQDALMGDPTGEAPVNRRDIQEHLSMIKAILSNVRWNYGPPTQVETITD